MNVKKTSELYKNEAGEIKAFNKILLQFNCQGLEYTMTRKDLVRVFKAGIKAAVK